MKQRKPRKPKSKGSGLVKAASTPDPIEHPVFCLRHLHPSYGVGACVGGERELLSTMANLSQQKWSHIYARSKHSGGTEKIPTASLPGKVPTDFATESDATVLRFSIAGRMAGFVVRGVFHVRWMSSTHSLY